MGLELRSFELGCWERSYSLWRHWQASFLDSPHLWGCITAASASTFTWPSPCTAALPTSHSAPLISTPSLGLTLNPRWSHPEILSDYNCEDPSQTKSHSQFPGLRSWLHLFKKSLFNSPNRQRFWRRGWEVQSISLHNIQMAAEIDAKDDTTSEIQTWEGSRWGISETRFPWVALGWKGMWGVWYRLCYVFMYLFIDWFT